MALAKIWLEATRPKTLPAAVAPVLLGSAMAAYHGQFLILPAFVCLAFALLIQIGTNFANDYLDGVKGTDTEARLGPRRAVASGLIRPELMKVAAIVVLAFAFCLGLSLIFFGGWWLLLVGIGSVVCAWIYTGGPYPLAYNGLGDIFVVLFFGLIAVACTFYVQTGKIFQDVLLLGLASGLLVNNILVVNNYRDVDEDRQANKRTLVVLFGRNWAILQYGLSLLLSGGVLVWLALRGYGHWILLAWWPLLCGGVLLRKLSVAKDAEAYLASLKGAALVVVGYAVIVSLCLFLF
jgi:1,4-dihydroxy-2-naphthoate octaprenyltransferase